MRRLSCVNCCVSLRPMRFQVSIFMRFAAISSFVIAASLSTPTMAQSFLETLFGSPKQAMPLPNSYRTPNRLLPPGSMQPSGINGAQPYTVRQMPQSRQGTDDEDGAAARANDQSRGYRTVCVRMCDGFYWPVSFSTPRSRLYRDATVCSSSCGAEAKLFHFASNGGQIDDAVDLTGRVYGRLPNAFKYRKALVQGCTCRPEPWSDAAVNRHRVYALNDGTASGNANPPTRSAEYAVPAPSGAQQNAMVSDAKDATSTATSTDAAPNPANASTVETTNTRGSSTARSEPPVSIDEVKSKAPAKARRVVASTLPQRAKVPSYPAASPQTASGSFWGNGQASKYSWPGDAPVRVR